MASPATAHSDKWPPLLPSSVAFVMSLHCTHQLRLSRVEGQPLSVPSAERDKSWEQAGCRWDILAQVEEH